MSGRQIYLSFLSVPLFLSINSFRRKSPPWGNEYPCTPSFPNPLSCVGFLAWAADAIRDSRSRPPLYFFISPSFWLSPPSCTIFSISALTFSAPKLTLGKYFLSRFITPRRRSLSTYCPARPLLTPTLGYRCGGPSRLGDPSSSRAWRIFLPDFFACADVFFPLCGCYPR